MTLKVWTCKDIMTADPVAATKLDLVGEVAQKMRSADVGLIPIVENHYSNKLVGVVTDRDLALRVLAEGLDVEETTAEEVMTPDPISCHVDASVSVVTEMMSSHQIRRVLVVDDFGRMMGIIAQADLARQLDAQSIGKVVEEISQEVYAKE
jgi:CBS domain-containing protein